MANIKLTQSNFDNMLSNWKTNKDTSRGDIFYFITEEINERDIRQVSWKKNILINISQVDNYVSKITFVDSLT